MKKSWSRYQIWWKITITITSRYQIYGRGKTLSLTEDRQNTDRQRELLTMPVLERPAPLKLARYTYFVQGNIFGVGAKYRSIYTVNSLLREGYRGEETKYFLQDLYITFVFSIAVFNI